MSIGSQGEQMLALPAHARIFLFQHPVSMRKSFEGLSAAVEQLFPGELLSGALFVFLNKRRNHLKTLFWDGDGFVIYFKRLEKGSYLWKWSGSPTIDRKSFLMILEGVTPWRIQKRFSLGN
jgi:transposase